MMLGEEIEFGEREEREGRTGKDRRSGASLVANGEGTSFVLEIDGRGRRSLHGGCMHRDEREFAGPSSLGLASGGETSIEDDDGIVVIVVG